MNLYLLDNNKNVDQTIELSQPRTRIGRETDNNICLLVGGVSRYHCELLRENEKWYINDTGSTNGTKVNNLQINGMYLLREGDLIDIGDQHLRFGDITSSTQTEVCAAIPRLPILEETAAMPVPDSPHPAKTAPHITLFDSTETVKGQIPLMELPADASTPSIIINLPQALDSAKTAPNNIFFEPVVNEQPPQQPPPTPSIKLTPEPAASIVIPQQPPQESRTVQPETTLVQPEPAKAKLPEGFSMFGKGKGGDPAKEAANGKRRSSNMLFYTSVICIPIIFISLFIIIRQSTKPAPPPVKTVQDNPEKMIISYEKKIITRDNVFRFHMLLDQGHAVFMLDDLKSRRHYLKEDKAVKHNLLTELYNDIKESDFMELSPVAAGSQVNETDEIRTMSIRVNNKFKTMVIRNNYAPSSFESIERAINEFAGQYGLQTISMTPEELKREADIAFNKAEELFNNRDAAPENLRKALIRYQVTVDYLDQFAPKPQQWTLAKKRIIESEEIVDKKTKDLIFDFNRLQKLKNDREALEVLDRLLPLTDPGSKNYQKYQEIRIKLENKIRKDSKK